ncbi:MAG: hypothetical protein KJ737_23725 [Proteobacteria bacterium]|nr:hypothetical protein [Pseudomonadota bacterium]
MASDRFKKIKTVLIGVVVIKLMIIVFFMFGKSTVTDAIVNKAIAQEDTGKNKNKEGDGTGEKEKDGEAGTAVEKDAEPAPDPRLMLAGLEEKRKQLLEKEEQLKLEQERLDVLKKEIEEKTEKLSGIYRQIEESLAILDKKETESERLKREAEEAKMAQLVKVFSSMKPKKAGEIINNMDLEVARTLFLKMKGDRAGEILSYVNSDKAAQISEKLTEKRDMFEGK